MLCGRGVGRGWGSVNRARWFWGGGRSGGFVALPGLEGGCRGAAGAVIGLGETHWRVPLGPLSLGVSSVFRAG